MALSGLIPSIFLPPNAIVNRRQSIETVIPRETNRRHPPGGSASSPPRSEIGLGPRPAALAAQGPAQALLETQRNGIGQTAITITLQGNALPSRQFRELGERKDDHLAVFADYRDGIRVLGDCADDGHVRSRPDIDQLLALSGLGEGRFAARDETLSVR